VVGEGEMRRCAFYRWRIVVRQSSALVRPLGTPFCQNRAVSRSMEVVRMSPSPRAAQPRFADVGVTCGRFRRRVCSGRARKSCRRPCRPPHLWYAKSQTGTAFRWLCKGLQALQRQQRRCEGVPFARPGPGAPQCVARTPVYAAHTLLRRKHPQVEPCAAVVYRQTL